MDIWAMGVITHFLLTGYTPFDRENQQLTLGRTDEYWADVSQTAKEFVTMCLTVDPAQRPTASEVLKHRWLADAKPRYVPDPGSATGGPTDLLPHIQKRLVARARCE
jgi:calcium/calmodulin-dependent protein kinase I